MISERVRDLLHKQIGHEFQAAHEYMAIATFFDKMGLEAFTQLFFTQAEEERDHGKKIMKFLMDVGADFTFPALNETKPSFASPLEAVRKALAWEQEVTKSFHTMAELALADKDFTTFQFLQWFIEEQVEEEDMMGKLVQMVESGVNLFTVQGYVARMAEH